MCKSTCRTCWNASAMVSSSQARSSRTACRWLMQRVAMTCSTRNRTIAARLCSRLECMSDAYADGAISAAPSAFCTAVERWEADSVQWLGRHERGHGVAGRESFFHRFVLQRVLLFLVVLRLVVLLLVVVFGLVVRRGNLVGRAHVFSCGVMRATTLRCAALAQVKNVFAHQRQRQRPCRTVHGGGPPGAFGVVSHSCPMRRNQRSSRSRAAPWRDLCLHR
ncbi:hypothetical protein XAC2852_790221 [Xanthomonas citri pv. citri]|nr:hypothetical protein XAC2852_790221 [Xanthomonas citri pv. citri]